MAIDPSLFRTNFTALDWGIVFIYIAGVACIGVLVNRFIKNTSDYMVGGRVAGLALNTASHIGTELGLVTVMYAAIDAYIRGFSYLLLPLLALCAAFILGRTGFVVTRLRALNLTTIPEFFERRFNRRIRITAAIILALAGILNMGLFPKIGATFITYATGLAAHEDPLWMVNLVMSGLIVLVVLYTIAGGMVAVIVCDYIQFSILSVGLLLGLYFSLSHDGLGWSAMVNCLAEKTGEAAFNPVHADSYGWLYCIWMFIVYLAAGIAWAPGASRILTAQDPTCARRTFLLGAPGQFVRLGIPALFALAAFTFFSQHAELSPYFFEQGAADPTKAAQAMPLFLGKIIPSGLIGILSAGLLAAFMSTHDSYFVSWASIISRDIICQFKRQKATDKQEIRYARITILLIGIFLLVWGLWYELPESVWSYMAITGNIYLTGATAALVGGIYWKGASSAGALAALLGGLMSAAGIIPAVTQLIPMGMLGLANFILCGILLIVFSLLFPDRERGEARP